MASVGLWQQQGRIDEGHGSREAIINWPGSYNWFTPEGFDTGLEASNEAKATTSAGSILSARHTE